MTSPPGRYRTPNSTLGGLARTDRALDHSGWGEVRTVTEIGDCYTAAPGARIDMRGAGGTTGGVGQFFFGLVMAAAGGYLLTQRVTVTTGFWDFLGPNSFGLSLLPLLVGVG